MDSEIERIPLGEIADCLDPPQLRKGGWHVTNLIGEALALSRGKRAEPFNPPANIWGLINMGRIWEFSAKPWLTGYAELLGMTVQYADRDNPLEASVDDILGNLDGLLMDHEGIAQVVVDTKFTTGKADMLQNSSREKYLHQLKAYCKMTGCNEAWFLTLSIPKAGGLACESYRQVFRFTPEEIEQTWVMIVSTKEYLESIGEVPND